MTAIFYQPSLCEPCHHLQTDIPKDEGLFFCKSAWSYESGFVERSIHPSIYLSERFFKLANYLNFSEFLHVFSDQSVHPSIGLSDRFFKLTNYLVFFWRYAWFFRPIIKSSHSLKLGQNWSKSIPNWFCYFFSKSNR